MKVEAKRDDGALLVTDGRAAIVVAPTGGTWLTSRESALTRGNWEPSTDEVPAAARGLAGQLRSYSTELDEQAARLA